MQIGSDTTSQTWSENTRLHVRFQGIP